MAVSILVVSDGSRQAISPTARELLSLARTLAEGLGATVNLLSLGARTPPSATEAGEAGADRVWRVPGGDRSGYHPEESAEIVLAICRESNPQVVLLPHTPLGVDLAPRVSFRLGLYWASNSVGVRLRDRGFQCTRSQVGGKVQVVEAVEGPIVVTLRPKSVEILPLQPDRSAAQMDLVFSAAATHGAVTLVERTQAEGGAQVELEQAEVIVSGGLGMGSAEAFEQLRQLAVALGGTVAASKQAVDRGWLPPSSQVGISGTTVAPRLYLTVGISGALQHMAGCSKSKTIVAVNKDPEAPIFRFARFGVVAEWEKVVPELLAQLRSAAE